MRDRTVFFLCVAAGGLTGLVLFAVAAGIPDINLGYFEHVNRETSCEGINEYYSGKGFIEDVNTLRHAIWGYNHSYEPVGIFMIVTPAEIDYRFWDCEDSSHAFWCLANLYNIPCFMYYTDEIGRKSDVGDHLGLECFVDGGWMEIN